MKQITFKEQVTIEQLEQRAKDGECVSLVGSGGKCIWYINELWHCTCDLEIECLDVFMEDWLEYAKSWTDTKTQLTVATGDVIHFSKLEPGDCIEWHDDHCRGRGIVDEVNQLWFDVHGWDKIFDDNTSATVYKRDLPPLHQPKKGVLRYKTEEELERDHYVEKKGFIWSNKEKDSICFCGNKFKMCGKNIEGWETLPDVWDEYIDGSQKLFQPWMTTTDPLPPLHQPKKAVLRYKTLYELERTEQYKRFGTLPINGDYHTNLTLRNVAGKPVSESPLKYYSWMTTTDPLP